MPKVAFAQFCDDVRQEMTGKYILIGCYGDTMQVKAFPLNTKLAVFVNYPCLGGVKSFKGQLSLASGATIGTVNMEVEESPYPSSQLTSAQIPIPGIQVNLSREDEIVFSFAADDEELQEIGRLKVELLPESDQRNA